MCYHHYIDYVKVRSLYLRQCKHDWWRKRWKVIWALFGLPVSVKNYYSNFFMKNHEKCNPNTTLDLVIFQHLRRIKYKGGPFLK